MTPSPKGDFYETPSRMSSNSNRRAKMEKEREKQVQDRLQVLICEMLKDEDNKYCVDCDSKGSQLT